MTLLLFNECLLCQLGVDNPEEITKNGLYAEPFQVAYGGGSTYSTSVTTQRRNQSLPLSSPDYTGKYILIVYFML